MVYDPSAEKGSSRSMAFYAENTHARTVGSHSPFSFSQNHNLRPNVYFPGVHRDDMVKLRAMMRGELDISLLREAGKLLFGDEAGLFDENPRPLDGATGSRLFDDETRILILRSLPNDKIETSFRGRNGLQEVLASVSME
jgi:hypothetical protein